jgi:hypothetical protein
VIRTIVEGEPGVFPDPVARIMRGIGGLFRRKPQPADAAPTEPPPSDAAPPEPPPSDAAPPEPPPSDAAPPDPPPSDDRAGHSGDST